jgi:hypothetical protein
MELWDSSDGPLWGRRELCSDSRILVNVRCFIFFMTCFLISEILHDSDVYDTLTPELNKWFQVTFRFCRAVQANHKTKTHIWRHQITSWILLKPQLCHFKCRRTPVRQALITCRKLTVVKEVVSFFTIVLIHYFSFRVCCNIFFLNNVNRSWAVLTTIPTWKVTDWRKA